MHMARYCREGALALALGLPLGAGAGPAKLKLGTHELPPYSQQVNGQAEGLAVQAVRCALRKQGVAVEFVFLPWARAQSAARQGELDGFFAASQSAERDAWAMLSAPIAPQQWRWYLLRESRQDPLSPEFRQQARVSSFLGGNMLSWLRQEGYQLEAAPPRNEQLLQMLLKRRVDAVLANHLVMERLLAEQDASGQIRSVLQQDKPLGVYFSQRFTAAHPNFLPRFNQALQGCAAR